MSKIEDLKQKIYTPAFAGRHKKPPEFSEPRPSEQKPWSENGGHPAPGSKNEKRYLSIALGVLLGAALLFAVGYASIQSGLLFYFLGKADVQMSIFSDPTVVAGQKLTYTISYKNKSNAPIKNVEIFFQYPKGSEPEQTEGFDPRFSGARVSIPSVAAGAEGTYQFRARIFGKEGDTPSAHATFTYQPNNGSSKFTLEGTQNVEISRVPIAMTFQAGAKVRSGEPYEFDVEYASNADGDFKNMYVQVFYPDGFQFQESNITPDTSDSTSGVWSLGTVQPGTSGSIHIKGILGGSPLEPKTFRYSLGSYTTNTHEWVPYIERAYVAEIVSPPLFVETKVDNATEPLSVSYGDEVHLLVNYKNNSTVPLKNVSVSAKLDGPVDFSTISVQNGATAGQGMVRWTGTTEPKLVSVDVGEEGTLILILRLKRAKDTELQKNAVLQVTTSIDADKNPALDIGLANTNTLTVPINAEVSFQAKALYSGSLIQNSGPIPPKVGVPTTYTIVWEIDTAGNDVEGAKITAVLPPYAVWTGTVVPSDENIIYQKGTGEIVWNAGSLSVDNPANFSKKVLFQISLTPSENQIGNQVTLLSNMAGDLTDSFTKKELQKNIQDITTDLIDDFGVPRNSGTVQK